MAHHSFLNKAKILHSTKGGIDLDCQSQQLVDRSNPVEVWLLDDRNRGRQIVSVLCTMLPS
jgi:hypothetical protein